MITQAIAEKLAINVVQDYVNQCDCETNEDVANVLMKLASVCGISICAVVGKHEAVARMEGTAEFIKNTPFNFKHSSQH